MELVYDILEEIRSETLWLVAINLAPGKKKDLLPLITATYLKYRILSDFVDIYESNVATSNTYVTCLLDHTVRKGKRSDLIITI